MPVFEDVGFRTVPLRATRPRDGHSRPSFGYLSGSVVCTINVTINDRLPFDSGNDHQRDPYLHPSTCPPCPKQRVRRVTSANRSRVVTRIMDGRC